MTRYILIHEDASLDLHEHFSYLSQNNRDSAFEFFDAARQTFAALARMPGVSQQYDSEEDIVNIRKWAVKGFKKYLIFYRYDDEKLEILRIIHATRDLELILRDL
ncbi:type II toxin-antitoxin system RelE/ParE family toxin [Chamaesiphon sp. OTE_75_metabat_556]|uniref:type II toxin-antitoxin system RelE/ParE family toxin n=1 Tax=Chamaesiphon sp. OTE_75_metabat_556 TaxID=2964692 RepID=UPI00286B8976|nr:type II toxin-antitoxin system RelE/ParE family toxin [Chamaesiphon sp. OTE_75_metabat_556]